MDTALASLLVRFDPVTGLSPDRPSLQRRLSHLAGIFADEAERRRLQGIGNRLVYEFHDLGIPATAHDIAFGTSIVYPGQVAGEYHLTKGHFHTQLETAEVYHCLRGKGFMLMENPEGDWEARELSPGAAVYVPGRYAHRSINTGKDTMVTFYAFRADAGHDYSAIETVGFRKLCVERNGQPAFIDNPRWAGGCVCGIRGPLAEPRPNLI